MSEISYRVMFFLLLLVAIGTILYYLDSNGIYKVPVFEQSFYSTITSSTTTSSNGRVSPVYNDSNRIGLGVATLQDDLQSIYDFEDLIGHKMKYVLLFKTWDGSDREFPLNYVKSLSNSGYEVIITWEPWKRDYANATVAQEDYSLKSIADGQHDELIHSWAISAKASKAPIILRFAHEPTTEKGIRSWYPWQGDPENYILAYRRIVDIFREEGVTNVSFMWNPLSYEDKTLVQSYYPGDSYVDYLGLTVINFGSTSDAKWLDCSFLLDKQLDVTSFVTKPIIITEFASFESGGDKVDWYSKCIDDINYRSSIVGVVSVQSGSIEKLPQKSLESRVDSSQDSLTIFIKKINEGSFK